MVQVLLLIILTVDFCELIKYNVLNKFYFPFEYVRVRFFSGTNTNFLSFSARNFSSGAKNKNKLSDKSGYMIDY